MRNIIFDIIQIGKFSKGGFSFFSTSVAHVMQRYQIILKHIKILWLLACMPRLLFRPNYVWFQVHFWNLWSHIQMVNWQK